MASAEDSGIKPSPADLREALKGGLLRQVRLQLGAMVGAPLVYLGLAIFAVQPERGGAVQDPVFVGLLGVVALGQLVVGQVWPMMVLKKFRYEGPGLGAEEKGRLLGERMRGYYVLSSAMTEAVALQALMLAFLYGNKIYGQPFFLGLLGVILGSSLWIASLWPSEEKLQELLTRAFFA